MRFLQILEGRDAKTAVVVVVTRDRSVLDAATRALNERLQGTPPICRPGSTRVRTPMRLTMYQKVAERLKGAD
jgi:hypothetical protein